MSAPDHLPLIAVTAGEPAGIGPDLCAMLAREALPARIVVIADRDLLAQRAAQIGVALELVEFDEAAVSLHESGRLAIRHVPLETHVTPGALDPANSSYVLRTLAIAADECLRGTFAAMVTAPVHKAVINESGIAFTGHTEFLAERTDTPHVVMMLVGGGMRVALATTHLALRDVPAAITRDSLADTLRILDCDLKRWFGIARPRILVAGLNPHAGESGHLGREEIDAIIPALEAFRASGHAVIGPLPADTLFNPARLAEADAVLAMYHDQGLPVLKHASFGSGVNVTLGLPIIRTSVDHGTALDLAGTGRAEVGSLMAAIELAAGLAQRATAQAASTPLRA
ncbi:MAG TPA: 4-hydroxythreonine-4-phosphate dehydrogenase PdxA [Burkholderiales bacterium]|nr:4-hydroxythreonine-4-phosphate dehydrogenase PdxA [Burkholderiales bacterium]